MRGDPGFRNCDYVTAADGPRQRNSGRRATTRLSDPCQRGVAQQVAAERRIGHHHHAALLAPWQQVVLNPAAADIIKNLISRAAIAMRNTKEVFHIFDTEVGYAPGANLS